MKVKDTSTILDHKIVMGTYVQFEISKKCFSLQYKSLKIC